MDMTLPCPQSDKPAKMTLTLSLAGCLSLSPLRILQGGEPGKMGEWRGDGQLCRGPLLCSLTDWYPSLHLGGAGGCVQGHQLAGGRILV